jgi:hypothetical protein
MRRQMRVSIARFDRLSLLDEELDPGENPSPALGVTLGLLGVAGVAGDRGLDQETRSHNKVRGSCWNRCRRW